MKSRFLYALSAFLMLPVQTALSQDMPAAPFAFDGRALIGVSDADMLASAYVNGKLGPREGRDALFSIPLGSHPRDLRATEIPASNSVAGPPAAIAVTPDGRFAFVVETFGPRPNDDSKEHTFKDLQPGAALRAFDISDLSAPKEVQALALPKRPDSVSINAAGDLLAVTFHPQGAGADTPLALIPFVDDRLGSMVTPRVPGWSRGNRMIAAEWHPTKPILAVADATSEQIIFYAVSDNVLTQWAIPLARKRKLIS